MFKSRYTNSFGDVLRETDLFRDCDRRDLQRVSRLVTVAEVPKRRLLMRQGAVGKECFVVVHGHAAVERNGASIGSIDDGQVVGELALLDHMPRSGTVTTEEPMTLLVMSQREFEALQHLAIPSVQGYLDEVAEMRRRRLRMTDDEVGLCGLRAG
jgi:CRP-like cAMP-binding protein